MEILIDAYYYNKTYYVLEIKNFHYTRRYTQFLKVSASLFPNFKRALKEFLTHKTFLDELQVKRPHKINMGVT